MTPESTAVICGLNGPRLECDEARVFSRHQPWGFILFARNVVDPAQLSRLTADLRDCVGWDAPVLIDQEGGRVQRLLPPFAHGFRDAAFDVGLGPRAFWLRGRLIAQDLAACGVDVNCAPVADLATAQTHPFLAPRCLGAQPDIVVENARAMAEGMLAGGVLPVIKHLPGHGRARADSHHGLPQIEAPLAQLESSDFEVFRRLNDLPIAMTGHLCLPELGPAPATINPRAIELIRTGLGFNGLLLSDDLTMHALSGPAPQRLADALAAGCDIGLMCHGELGLREAVLRAAPRLSEGAQARAAAALALRTHAAADDLAALADEARALGIFAETAPVA